MFAVDEQTAAAIRDAFDRGGELGAVIQLRRHCPGITDNSEARRCARTIAARKSLAPGAAELAQAAPPR